jgi:hypothetical protein
VKGQDRVRELHDPGEREEAADVVEVAKVQVVIHGITLMREFVGVMTTFGGFA